MVTYKVVVDLSTDTIFSVGSQSLPQQTQYAEFFIDFANPPSVGDSVALTYQEKRQAAYKNEADPLYFAYIASVEEGAPQADIDAAKQAWLDKRNEIKARYPKV